jgi:LacI family transcriptional regulator
MNIATITEIANRLQLSKTTVSRVFNNAPNSRISAATRKRVWEAIEKTGYEPNISARALARAKTHVIGTLFINASNPFVGEFVAATEAIASNAGYHVLLCNTRGSSEREQEECRMLRQRGVEGLIIEHFDGPADHLAKMAEAGYPFVLLDRCEQYPELDYVTFDDVEGGRLATMALIEAGRKRIAHISGPQTSIISNDRSQGYLKALNQAGLPAFPELSIRVDVFGSREVGRLAADRLLDLPDRPDGIFCDDDFIALGVFDAAKARGIRVPQDLSLIGYDDSSFCPLTAIPLASVKLDMSRLGHEATQLLLEKIESHEVLQKSGITQPSGSGRSVIINPQVMKRESLGTV